MLSTLYFARSLRVHSLNKLFRAVTAAVINGEEIEVISAPERIGTEIRRCGVEPSHQGRTLAQWVAQELMRLCEVFAVRVTFNGDQVNRPLAQSCLTWRDTAVGKVHIDLEGMPS